MEDSQVWLLDILSFASNVVSCLDERLARLLDSLLRVLVLLGLIDWLVKNLK